MKLSQLFSLAAKPFLFLLERADVHHSSYIRVRGTNTDQLEQEIDPAGEDPWTDLWFYSNPALYEPCKYRQHNFNLN